jgi:hypothetical protein
MNNCLHTGGSVGGDSHFEHIAEKLGHEVVKYQFDGYKNTRIIKKDKHTLVIMSDPEKTKCDHDIESVCNKLKVKISSSYEKHLLERDWILIHFSHADSLYAIGHWQDRPNGIIEGGTGIIIELFKMSEGIHFPVIYFHCIETNMHYRYTINGWVPMDHIPIPEGKWIGIGSRNLKNNLA